MLYYCIYTHNDADTEFHLLKNDDLTPVTATTAEGIVAAAKLHPITNPIYLLAQEVDANGDIVSYGDRII